MKHFWLSVSTPNKQRTDILNNASTRILSHLNACTCRAHLRQIQAQLILHNLLVDTTLAHHLITAYQSPLLLDFLHLFYTTQIHRPHVFICNSLIRAFSHSHTPRIPFSIYAHMRKAHVLPNNYTFPFLLKSLSDSRELTQSQCIHTHVLKLGHADDVYVGNALLDVYASCGRVGLCRKVFDEMRQRDVVSWTVLIMGYRNAGRYEDALFAFEQMQYAGVVPNRVTMVNALAACASCGALEMGVWIHEFIKREGWEVDVKLGTSLVDMYGKCGRVEEGLAVFRSMPEKNSFTWNAVIQGLALAKSGEEAVWWFNRMEQEGFKADGVTLVAVLCACSHSGLVDMGRQIFSALVNGKYGFSPTVKHYACMVDILTRAGHLEEAFECVKVMPHEPTKSIWVSLLAGGRAHGNLDLSEYAAWKLIELEPENGVYHVMLSNMYAQMGRWDDVEKVRGMMKDRDLKKDLGCSSVELEFQEPLYQFVA